MNTIQKKLIWIKSNEKNVLDFHGDDLMIHLNVHQIGTIQSFDASTQTASASVDVQKVIYVQDPQTNLTSQQLLAYPPLTDCPVKFNCGLNGGITVPPKKGDKCLVHFNDRDIDAWMRGAIDLGPDTARLHDFSDAIIEIGPNPEVAPLPNFSTQYAMLRNGVGTSFVGVDISDGKISIQNPSQNLAVLLQQLISAIKGLSIDVAAIAPGGGTVDPTSQLTLTNIGTALGEVIK